MAKLHVSPDLSLSSDLVTQTIAVLAKRGVGKTYLASVIAEEMLKAGQQVVVIDPTGAWFGLKSSADGKHEGFPVAIFGGEHADVPLEEDAGEVIATAIVERRFSAILDLSFLRKNQRNKFMTAFLETLFRLNRLAMHLFVDEAHTIAPQKPFGEEARMLGAIEDVVMLGRRRGIGCTLITQRPQVLAKNVLTQCEVLCAMRLVHPKDIDAVEEWVNVHADPKKAKEMIDSLPSLPVGTAWFWSPGFGDIFKQVKIRQRETFDSSATPKSGETARNPKVLAPVDIEQLGQQITATVQRAKENDPAALKRRIAELEKKAVPPKPAAPVIEQKIVEIPVLRDDQIREFQNCVKELVTVAQIITEGLAKAQKRPVAVAPRPAVATIQSRPAQRPPVSAESNGKLRDGAERMLAALCQFYPGGMPDGRLRSHAGLKKSGTYSAYKSDLFRYGYVEKRGDDLFATQNGMDYFGGDVPAAPQSTQEVVDLWSSKLRDGARRMLNRLIEHGGEYVPHEQLYEESKLVKSGTASAYLSDLKRAQLAVVNREGVAANRETLFL